MQNNTATLVSEIDDVFANIGSNIPLLLPEADYLDYYVRPFGFPDYPYSYEGDFDRNLKEIMEDLMYWKEEDRVYAIQCIKENKKMKNQYKHWREIRFDYLDWYYNGFSYIDNIGFLFYTPAVMVGFLLSNNGSSTGLAISWWYNRIQRDFQENNLDNLLNFFNYNQSILLIKFLELCGNKFVDKYSLDMSIIVDKIKSIKCKTLY